MLRFHTQTSGVTLTAQQPDNNVIRVAVQALAAVLGGTQSLHTNSKDEALALPSEESVRLALRTQQILAHETGVTHTVDPLAGSYFIEDLTDRLERQAQDYIDEIDRLGGMVNAVEQGHVQRLIEQAAYSFGTAIESGKRVVVGVNRYIDEPQPPFNLFSVPEEAEQRQIAAVAAQKAGRDPVRLASALAEIERAARSDANLMPSILQAVRAAASVGEICHVLQDVFGEYTEHLA